MASLFFHASSWTSKLYNMLSTRKKDRLTLQAFIKNIDNYNATQFNSEMLNAIRQYNHSTLDSLNSIRPLSGLRILDVGASPHGYALEKSLLLGVSEYVGVGLDISESYFIETQTGRASLVYMNAQSLSFDDSTFDVIITMSTFEHITDLRKTLSEFYRVLKQYGIAFITFEPIWTCSYGHHLHHFGEIPKLVPDWAHLLWSKNEMNEYLLMQCWPQNAPLSISEACAWIYENEVLNRIGIREMLNILSACQLNIEWIVPIPDKDRNEEQLIGAIEKTGLSRDELMTRGLSILLSKP